MNVQDLLDAAKTSAGANSDYALAMKLGAKKQTVSNWRCGTNAPDAVMCEKLAVLTGFPLHRVLGIVGETRAISIAEKRVWHKLATAIFVSLLVLPYPVLASVFPTNGMSEQHAGLGIMRSIKGPRGGTRTGSNGNNFRSPLGASGKPGWWSGSAWWPARIC
jgi:hypothetical protein